MTHDNNVISSRDSTVVTYIAFLRAINVGGHLVKSERLRKLFHERDEVL